MISEPGLFKDLAYVFLAAVLGGALARYARQPLILGYVLGGLLISPLTPGPSVADIHTFERFAEIGVILLMFSLGIEFSLKDLAGVKWIAILGGPPGLLMTVGLAMAGCPPAGRPQVDRDPGRPARQPHDERAGEGGWRPGRLEPDAQRGRRHGRLGRQHDGPGASAAGPRRDPFAARPHPDRD